MTPSSSRSPLALCSPEFPLSSTASTSASAPRASADHATLRRLLADRAFLGKLRGYASRLVPRPQIDDLLQDAYVEALSAKRSPEDIAACTTWMRRVLQGKAADQLRHAPPPGCALEENELPPEEAPERARDQLAWVQREVAAGRLDPQTLSWMVRHAEGDSLAQIAQEMGQSLSLVRQRLHHHRKKLRARLARARPVEGPRRTSSRRSPTARDGKLGSGVRAKLPAR